MNTKQRNYYEHVIVNMMNRFAKYINSLVDFSKKYNNAIEEKNDYFIIEIEVPLNQIFHNDEENLI